jgi:hypothetical protein
LAGILDLDPDPYRIEVKSWIRIHIENNADPKTLTGKMQFRVHRAFSIADHQQ